MRRLCFFAASLLGFLGTIEVVCATTALPPTVSYSIPIQAQDIDYSLTAQQLTNLCDHVLSSKQRQIDTILARPPHLATFANTIIPLENLNSDINDALVAVMFLGSVSSDRTIRGVSDQCQNRSNELFVNLNTRHEFALQLKHIMALAAQLAPADAKLLEFWNLTVQRAGAPLSTGNRAEVRTLMKRIDALETAYMANLANDTSTIELADNQLRGIPKEMLAGFTRLHSGFYRIQVGEGTKERFMTNAADPLARERYLNAYQNRGYPHNIPILREVLALRLRLAQLLGWPTWADYVLADHLAKDPQKVQHFLDDLDQRLLPAARADLQRLSKEKAFDLHVTQATIQPWDVAYYHERHLQRNFAIDQNTVREYFPVRHTIQAVFGIYAKLLGLRFIPVVPAHAWDSEVQEFAVYDASGPKFRGTLYLDLYPRPGKYTHFANFPLLPLRRLPNGTLREPVDAIVGNWSRSSPGEPALLSHAEVETFFHEFGHAMATILARTPYESLSSGFRTDFVEAPSQMLENWVWNPQILRELSSNVRTGLPLPDRLIDKLIATRYIDEAYFTTLQILYADVDLAYHSAHPGSDPTQVWREKASSVTPMPMMVGVHPEASFGHIMGGYDGGYYGYLWSKVYAQDLFTAFETGGLENPIIGERYKHAILEPAREREPDEEVRQFLGRPMSPAAFYRNFGLTAPTEK